MRVGPRSYVLVAAAALVTSILSLRNGFVYDDVRVIQGDERVHSLHQVADLVRGGYWTGDARDKVYRPLTSVSFAVDWSLGGGSPLPFHAGNILLHVLASLLVLDFVRSAMGRGAEVAALWFAVHPLHVEAVANAVGRAELLAAAAYLGAVLLYRRDGRLALEAPSSGKRFAASAGTLVCAALAMGAKEHALTLPAGLMLVDWWEARVTSRGAAQVWARHLLLWAAVLTLGVAYLAARVAAVGSIGAGSVAPGLEGLSLARRAMVMLPAVLVWIRLFVFPLHLSADYSPNAFVPLVTLSPWHLVAVFAIALAVFIGWVTRRRAPAICFGLLWIVVTGSVAANVIVPTGVIVAERVLYLPSVGAAIVVGALWALLPRRRVVTALTIGALLMLAARSVTRIAVWSDEPHFYRALLHDAPDSYRSYWARGATAFDRDSAVEGETWYRQAIAIYPDPAVVQELGERYLTARLYPPADRFLTTAWRMDPLRSDAALEAVVARQREGEPDSAAALGQESLLLFPDLTTLLLATSDAELARGNALSALTLRRRAAYLRPGLWQYQQVTAAAAARAGLCGEARRRAEAAARLAPRERAPRLLLDSLDLGLACRPRP